jgi:NAD(P)-dependent dehydrogenase (short-subunit alcohol dehydrogenase family)
VSREFAGRTAIVTGAASGIGAEIARQLAAAGAHVLATDVSEARLAGVVDGITDAGGSARAMRVDVAQRDDLQRAVDAVVAEHGRLDYLFSNAGVGIFGEMDEVSLDEADTIVDVNLRGVLYGVGIAYRQMVRQGHGHIVCTASAAGLMPVPLQSHYVATKHAVVGLTQSLALEAASTGVRTTVFCPAWVESAMFDTSILHGSMVVADPRQVVPIKPLATDVAVRRLLQGVLRGRRFVITPFYGRLGWWLERFSPTLSHHLHRAALAQLRRRTAAARQK